MSSSHLTKPLPKTGKKTAATITPNIKQKKIRVARGDKPNNCSAAGGSTVSPTIDLEGRSPPRSNPVFFVFGFRLAIDLSLPYPEATLLPPSSSAHRLQPG